MMEKLRMVTEKLIAAMKGPDGEKYRLVADAIAQEFLEEKLYADTGEREDWLLWKLIEARVRLISDSNLPWIPEFVQYPTNKMPTADAVGSWKLEARS
jgi:hypothetical protein